MLDCDALAFTGAAALAGGAAAGFVFTSIPDLVLAASWRDFAFDTAFSRGGCACLASLAWPLPLDLPGLAGLANFACAFDFAEATTLAGAGLAFALTFAGTFAVALAELAARLAEAVDTDLPTLVAGALGIATRGDRLDDPLTRRLVLTIEPDAVHGTATIRQSSKAHVLIHKPTAVKLLPDVLVTSGNFRARRVAATAHRTAIKDFVQCILHV